jgi:hypothetical protein
VKGASIDPVEVASTDPIGVLKCKIWTARPRTGSAADNRANASKTFNAAAVIALVVEDLAAVALAAAADVVAKETASPINYHRNRSTP